MKLTTNMLLAVDIGNTTIHFGVFDRGRLKTTWTIPTPRRGPRPLAVGPCSGSSRARRSRVEGRRSGGHGLYPWGPTRPSATSAQLVQALSHRRSVMAAAAQVVLCSVVPSLTPVLSRALRSLGAGPIRKVGRDIRVPLKNRYRRPRQVGQDRLVGAFAAWCEFGDGAPRGRPGGRNPERGRKAESRDCIVVDFGTAITIDLVTRQGEYLGGLIAPGPGIALEALATRTALLPMVELKEPPELLGRDTASSIRSGVLHGSAALCDGLIARLKRRYAPKATVIGTGGAATLIAKHARSIDHFRPHLVLEGLRQLASFRR